MNDTMSELKRQAEISLEELAELQAKRELVPLRMIDKMCALVDEQTKEAIRDLHRASIQERRELDDEIKIAQDNAKALVIATGATIKFAGLTASFRKGRRYLDQAYVKEQLSAHGEDPDDDIFYKIGRPSCSIKTRK